MTTTMLLSCPGKAETAGFPRNLFAKVVAKFSNTVDLFFTLACLKPGRPPRGKEGTVPKVPAALLQKGCPSGCNQA